MEFSDKNANINIKNEPKDIHTPLADLFKHYSECSDPKLIKELCQKFLQNDEIGFQNGTITRNHMERQVSSFQDWIMEVSLGSSSDESEEEFLQAMTIDGNADLLNSQEKQLIRDFYSMPLLHSVYVFQRNNFSDFWFILTKFDHSIMLKYARKFREFLESQDKCNFDYLVLSREQLTEREIPPYSCKIILH